MFAEKGCKTGHRATHDADRHFNHAMSVSTHRTYEIVAVVRMLYASVSTGGSFQARSGLLDAMTRKYRPSMLAMIALDRVSF